MPRKKEEIQDTTSFVEVAESSPDVEVKPGSDPVLTECDVLVTKGLETAIATTVFKHELPILMAAHGPDRVEVAAEREVIVPGFNPAAEWARLARKYKSRNTDNLERAYPLGLEQLEQRTGYRALAYEAPTEALIKVRERPAVRRAAT